jgi:predicted nucleic acid-binding protein
MSVLVDSSVWIDYLRGDPTPAVRALHAIMQAQNDDIITADLIVLEVARGCRTEGEADHISSKLLQLRCVSLGGVHAALRAAALYRELRGQGITVAKTVDFLIASWCIHEGVALLHDDADFLVFERYGLRQLV